MTNDNEHDRKKKDKKARALFGIVMGMSQDERETFLDSVCTGDPELKTEIQGQIRAAGETVRSDAPRPRDSYDPQATGEPYGPGDRIGPYVIRRKIGGGGFGNVYEALQTEGVRRVVALKVLKPGMDSAQILARFEVERQALALMDHPSIARVYDPGATDRGLPYFVMEYVPGKPLTLYCDEVEMSVEERLKIFLRICDAVHHAHQKGVIHRDLKPSNILAYEVNGRTEIRVIDFGVARATNQVLAMESIFTQVGMMVGTPEYMAPEQAAGKPDVDTRADVYSLGAILYELLVGRGPFDSAELRQAGFDAMREQILKKEPARPSMRLASLGDDSLAVAKHRLTSPKSLARQVRSDLDWITMRALSKTRRRRYSSVAELGEDVRRFLRREPVDAGPPGLRYRAEKFILRHRFGVAAASLLALSVIGGATASTIGFVRASRAEQLARFEANTSGQVVEFLVGIFESSDPTKALGTESTARELLGHGVDKIEGRLHERPAIRARLLGTMGRVHRTLGMHPEAATLFGDAILDARDDSVDPLELAEYLSGRAGSLLRMPRRKYMEALPLLEEAKQIHDENLPDVDPRLARVLNNLGLVERFRNDKEAALRYFQEAYEVSLSHHGPDAPELIRPLSNMASLLRSLDRDDEAEERYREVLVVADRAIHANDPRRARLLLNLGNLYRSQERYDEAIPRYEEALEIRRSVLPEDHPDTINALAHLGQTLVKNGERDRALVVLREAIERGERTLDAEAPQMRRARDALTELEQAPAE